MPKKRAFQTKKSPNKLGSIFTVSGIQRRLCGSMILFLISRIHPVKITSLDREQSNQSLAEVAGISLVYFKKLKNR